MVINLLTYVLLTIFLANSKQFSRIALPMLTKMWQLSNKANRPVGTVSTIYQTKTHRYTSNN